MNTESDAIHKPPRLPGIDAIPGLARRHALFLGIFLAGALLRLATQFAYRPALLYIDSHRYLENAAELDPTRTNPLGYALFIRPLLHAFDSLAWLPVVNHLLGLGMACLIYAVLLHRGVWRWLAALATAPVLLDAYQLQIEQMVMSDTLFQVVLVSAFALLIWQRKPSLAVAATVGLLLGFSVWVRLIGEPLIIPAAIYLLLVGRAWWRRLINVAVCSAMFAAPLVIYADWHDDAGGKFRINYQTSYVLYARVAPIVDCGELQVPDYERPLCPKLPEQQRPNEDWYFWSGPVRVYQPPPGRAKHDVVRDFFLRVVKQQPWAVAEAVLWDYAKSFAWEKHTFGNDLPVSRWRFQLHYPMYEREDTVVRAISLHGGGVDGRPQVSEPLARFLRGYQLSAGFTPGPFLFAALAAAVVASLGMGRARESGLRAASITWSMAGVGIVLASDLYEFSWRYQLPALVLLPVAGALGATAILRRWPPVHDETGTPEPSARLATTAELDSGTRRHAERRSTRDYADEPRTIRLG